ncbi:MAG: MaoC/PaaZ C-terminal domain-containing protein [Yersinia sp. (in: enterobacteria)]
MYKLEDIQVGMSASYSQTITDSDIKSFAALPGDRNPVHMDEEYAESFRYKKRIAHGMFSTSFFLPFSEQNFLEKVVFT